jgi:hypothetical protein
MGEMAAKNEEEREGVDEGDADMWVMWGKGRRERGEERKEDEAETETRRKKEGDVKKREETRW